MSRKYFSNAPAETQRIAGRLARFLSTGDVVLFLADLGAGKTTFVQGVARALRAKGNGLETVMGHRSGETTDATMAHLGTAFGCIFLKTGVVGGERIAKLNELIRIEELI